jgi:hypothetical protein
MDPKGKEGILLLSSSIMKSNQIESNRIEIIASRVSSNSKEGRNDENFFANRSQKHHSIILLHQKHRKNHHWIIMRAEQRTNIQNKKE